MKMSDVYPVFEELKKEEGKGRVLEIYRQINGRYYKGDFEKVHMEGTDVVVTLSRVEEHWNQRKRYRPRVHISLFKGNCKYRFL